MFFSNRRPLFALASFAAAGSHRLRRRIFATDPASLFELHRDRPTQIFLLNLSLSESALRNLTVQALTFWPVDTSASQNEDLAAGSDRPKTVNHFAIRIVNYIDQQGLLPYYAFMFESVDIHFFFVCGCLFEPAAAELAQVKMGLWLIKTDHGSARGVQLTVKWRQVL